MPLLLLRKIKLKKQKKLPKKRKTLLKKQKMRLRQQKKRQPKLKKKLNNTRHLIAKTDSDYSESVFYLYLSICNLLSDDLKGRLKHSKRQTAN